MPRPAHPDDREAILELAQATGLFATEEFEAMTELVDAFYAGELGDGHRWTVDDDGDGRVRAAAYYGPELLTSGTWNLYFIGVHPDEQGSGRGGALLRHVEDELRSRGERMLIVETSGVEGFGPQRAFYAKHGFDEEARIRDFYRAGDDKVVFRKAL